MADENMMSTNDVIEKLQNSDLDLAHQLLAYTRMIEAEEGRTAAMQESIVRHCLDVEVRGEKLDPVHQFAYGILRLTGAIS